MTDEDDDAMEAVFDSPAFKLGMDIGQSLGSSHTIDEAQRAYDVGEIELFLDWHRPKTMEEWDEYYEKYGKGFGKRWASKSTESESEGE